MWQDYGKKGAKKRKRSHAGSSGLVNPGQPAPQPSDAKTKVMPFTGGINMNRVQAQIQIDTGASPLSLVTADPTQKPETITARIVLADLTPQGVVAFTQAKVRLGQKIKLTILDEPPFYCKAHAIWVMEILTGTIITQEPSWPYRIGFEFLCESNEERARIEDYCHRTGHDPGKNQVG